MFWPLRGRRFRRLIAGRQFFHPSFENTPNPGFSFSNGHLFLFSDGLFSLPLSRLALGKTMSVRLGIFLEIFDFAFINKLLLDQFLRTAKCLCNSVEDIVQAYPIMLPLLPE